MLQPKLNHIKIYLSSELLTNTYIVLNVSKNNHLYDKNVYFQGRKTKCIEL